MRIHKYRGKRVDGDGWVYGYYYQGNNLGAISHVIIRYERLSGEDVFYEVHPETVGKYIGLTDEEAVEIYEGDIYETPYMGTGVIRYNEELTQYECFVKDNSEDEQLLYVKDPDTGECGRVVGNIYDG